MGRSLFEDYYDQQLFDDYPPGVYVYEESSDGGKSATGSLALAEIIVRDSHAQLKAGGEDRRPKNYEWGHDEGGHLIGARFGGSTGSENLVAQDSNLNRSAYKKAENSWADHLVAGDKVFVNIETTAGNRPNCFLGYAVIEHSNGSREFETYSFINESSSQLSHLDNEVNEMLADDSTLSKEWKISEAAEEYSTELDDWGDGGERTSDSSNTHGQTLEM